MSLGLSLWSIPVLLAAGAPGDSPMQAKVFLHPGLHVPVLERPVSEMGTLAPALAQELASLGAPPEAGFYDWRAGSWGSLVVSVPFLDDKGVPDESRLQQLAWDALRSYLRTHEERLHVDLAELPEARIAVFDHGNLIQIHAARVVGGIPVRGSGVSAVLNHGNLVLLGIQGWGRLETATVPSVTIEDARATVAAHLKPIAVSGRRAPEHLEIVALARGEDVATVTRGAGYDYRLAWVLEPEVPGDRGSWEALVGARSGELLAFEDKNQYAVRRVVGGVYPENSNQVPPGGVEQPGWPMPFADVVAGASVFTSTGGMVPGCVPGPADTHLDGQFIRISDFCGGINETSATDIDLGVSAGTNCVVPPGHSQGDTHASRTSFYHLNRIAEQARGYLPGNAWLLGQLTANVNMVASCSAFWDGTTVNFYQASGGCSNTGENASIVSHEWGHGLDNNGVNPNITQPQEAIADIYAILRLNRSCEADGILPMTCGGYGDECDECTGVRELDWIKHRCDRPHTISWILNGFTSAECNNTGAAPACPPGSGPCGKLTHCEGHVPAEVGWDLQLRDLRAPPFNYDSNTALELTTRLMYLAPQTLTNWYTCGAGCAAAGTCGCGATGGYLLTLATDDDNGNIADGTPHMSAIRAAFERHEIHCSALPVVDSGCAGGPVAAPVVIATAVGNGVSLNWAPVPGASRYDVYRAEGGSGCDIGKVKAGETTLTSFLDAGLLDGRPYSYGVLPVGANDSCLGLMSACASATPGAGINPCATVEMSFTQPASTVAETAGIAPAVVVLTTPNGQPTTVPATVDFATADGTAAAGSDYTATAGTLTFPTGTPNGATQSIDVPVLDDALDEADEDFSVVLSNPAGGALGAIPLHVVTLTDDDPTPALSIADASAREGPAGTTVPLTFDVSLTSPSGQAVTVSYGTVDNTAKAGTDYQAATGSLSFAPGSVAATVAMVVNGDDIREGDEDFFVDLTNPVNATLADGEATGLIVDDDSWPELTHGQSLVANLRAQPGPTADADIYQLSQKPYASYEVIVDGLSGDVGPFGAELDRLASNGTPIQGSVPASAGSSRSLRWENATAGVVGDEHIRVRAPGCTTSCGPEDVYRARLYETTAVVARFNNSASQTTVMTLENLSPDAVAGNVRFWSPAGALLGSQPFSLSPRGALTIDTSAVPGVAGQSGSVTVASDGAYGALAGKAVAVEPATGFTFDSPLVPRPR